MRVLIGFKQFLLLGKIAVNHNIISYISDCLERNHESVAVNRVTGCVESGIGSYNKTVDLTGIKINHDVSYCADNHSVCAHDLFL